MSEFKHYVERVFRGREVLNLMDDDAYNTNRPLNVIIPELCDAIVALRDEMNKTLDNAVND